MITGCTKHPAFNSKYCQEHCSEESPAVTASSISSRTRQQLRKYRTDTATYAEAEQDEVYIVESIMEIKGTEVLVKWVGFPDPTWENENGIPKFIRNYYENNPAKLGKVLPNPKIKHSKAIGDTVIHKLSWGDEPGAEWMSDDFFKLLDEKGEITESTLSSCNTRKSRDKRQNVHSVGVFTGAYPCGIIVLGDELYGSESISQVYGILTDWLSSLSDQTKLKQILYDDMMLEEEEAGETVRSKLAFVKALRGKDKPRGFLAKLGGQFFGTEEEESNFEKDFLEASIKLSERKPNYGKRKLLNSSLLFTMFLLVKREYEESDDEVVKEMWREIFCSENAFFEWVIAELDRADEVEELLAEDVAKQGSTAKKKRKDDGVEGELEDNVEALL